MQNNSEDQVSEDDDMWAAVQHEMPYNAVVQKYQCNKILHFDASKFQENEKDGVKRLFTILDEKKSTPENPSYIVVQVLKVAATKKALDKDGRYKISKLNFSDVKEVLDQAYERHLKDSYAEDQSDIEECVAAKEKKGIKKNKDNKKLPTANNAEYLNTIERNDCTMIDELKRKQENLKQSENLNFNVQQNFESPLNTQHVQCEIKINSLKLQNECLQKQVDGAQKITSQMCSQYEQRIKNIEKDFKNQLDNVINKIQVSETNNPDVKEKSQINILKNLCKEKDAIITKVTSERDSLMSKIKAMKSEIDSLKRMNTFHKTQESSKSAKRRLIDAFKEGDGTVTNKVKGNTQSITKKVESPHVADPTEVVDSGDNIFMEENDFPDEISSERCSTPKLVEANVNKQKRSPSKSPILEKKQVSLKNASKKAKKNHGSDTSLSDVESANNCNNHSYESDKDDDLDDNKIISINFKIDDSLEIYLVHSDGKIDSKLATKFIDFKPYLFKLSNGKKRVMYHLTTKVFIRKQKWDKIKLISHHREFIRSLLDEMWGLGIAKKALRPNRTKERIEGEQRESFTPKKWKALNDTQKRFLQNNKYDGKKVNLSLEKYKKTDPKKYKTTLLYKAICEKNTIIKNRINNRIKQMKEKKENNEEAFSEGSGEEDV